MIQKQKLNVRGLKAHDPQSLFQRSPLRQVELQEPVLMPGHLFPKIPTQFDRNNHGKSPPYHPVDEQYCGRPVKNDAMQGARILRNEAHLHYSTPQ